MGLDTGRISRDWEPNNSTYDSTKVSGESGDRSVEAIDKLLPNPGKALLESTPAVETTIVC